MAQPLDPQLRLLTSLNLSPRGKCSVTNYLRTNDYIIDEESTKPLLFLSWISRCFVPDASGLTAIKYQLLPLLQWIPTYSTLQRAAASLTGQTDNILISFSLFAAQYLTLRIIYWPGYRTASGSLPGHEESIADRVWKRFLRKIVMLKTHFLASGGFGTLDNLVCAWLCWRATREKDGERSADIIALARHYTDGDNHACLEKSSRLFLMKTMLRKRVKATNCKFSTLCALPVYPALSSKQAFSEMGTVAIFLKQMLPTSFYGLSVVCGGYSSTTPGYCILSVPG